MKSACRFTGGDMAGCRKSSRRAAEGDRKTGQRAKRYGVRLWICSCVLAVLLSLAATSALGAEPQGPLDVIRSTTNRVLGIVLQATRGDGPSLEQRREEILGIVDESFDFAEMSKRALGRPWKDQRPEKQGEFVGLFTRLLFNTYVKRVEATASVKTRAYFDQETLDGDYAMVKTRLSNGEIEVRLDYRLLRGPAGWKVYDVIIEDVSLVSNYRQQFAAVLSGESFDGLLKMLREKAGT